MVVRLAADGIEMQTREGDVRAVHPELAHASCGVRGVPPDRHASGLAQRQPAPLCGEAVLPGGDPRQLSTPPTAAEVQQAVEKDFRWRLAAGDGVYALERRVTGRVVITNYDPRTLSDAERQALNTRAGTNPGNFVLIDIRPGHPGGDFPLFGALKLRSFNTILSFVAADHGASGEYEVTRDPRTGDSGPNPRRALEIEVTVQAPPGLLPPPAMRAATMRLQIHPGTARRSPCCIICSR